MKAADDLIVPLTLTAEASSETSAARRWIVRVMYNRTLDRRYPGTMAEVALQPYQFSEFNRDRADWANLKRVLGLADDDPQWLASLADYRAEMADVTAGVADPTGGATHFYDGRLAAPDWARPPARLTGKQGEIMFWADVP